MLHNQMVGKTGTSPPPTPPIFWMQTTCFHEVASRVLLQNIQNKGVVCKIVQDKELRDDMNSAGKFLADRRHGTIAGKASVLSKVAIKEFDNKTSKLASATRKSQVGEFAEVHFIRNLAQRVGQHQKIIMRQSGETIRKQLLEQGSHSSHRFQINDFIEVLFLRGFCSVPTGLRRHFD